MGLELSGNIPPIVTPVEDRGGSLDLDALCSLTRSLVDGGVDGVLACGTTGEFMALTREQRRAVIETSVEAAGSVPVLAGCGDESVGRTRQHVEAATAAGADVALVLTPSFWQNDPGGLAEFYERVAEDSPLPVMLYHLPDLTGQSLPVDTVVTLSEHDRIVGIKDTSRDLVRCHDIVRRTEDSFHLFQGSSMLIPASIEFGADGFVTSPANVFPEIHTRLSDASMRGDHETTAEIMQSFVYPFLADLSEVNMIATVKHMLERQGHSVGPMLPPAVELTDAEKRLVERVYEEVADTELIEG